MAAAASFGVISFPRHSNQRLRVHPISSTTSFSLPKSTVAVRCSSPANRRSKMEFVVRSGHQVADLLPHLPQNWPAWIPGVVVALIVPFFTNKWGPFSKFKAELDKVEEAVDKVADEVEEMAEKIEEFVGDIADDLPEGSRFRQSLEDVENMADTIAKEAKMVSDMVDKMDEMEAKLEDMLDKATEKKTTTTPTNIEPQ